MSDMACFEAFPLSQAPLLHGGPSVNMTLPKVQEGRAGLDIIKMEKCEATAVPIKYIDNRSVTLVYCLLYCSCFVLFHLNNVKPGPSYIGMVVFTEVE